MGQPEAARALNAKSRAVAAAMLLSRVLGLAREQAIAYLFGAGDLTDALAVAFRIPNLFRNLLAEGAVSAALSPVLVEERERLGEARARRVAALLLRGGFVSASLIAAAGALAAGPLVSIVARGFQATPGKLELTVALTRVLMPYLPLVAVAAVLMAVLNASDVFLLPALGSALFNLVSVCTGVALAIAWRRGESFSIEGMALGVVAGGIAQAFFQLPAAWRKLEGGARANVAEKWRADPAVRRAALLLGPTFLGLAATQVNMAANTFFAASVGWGPGPASWLTYAFRLIQLPLGVFGASVATVAIPHLARLRARGDSKGASAALEEALALSLGANLQAASVFAFGAVAGIGLLFQHGRFDSHATEATARALVIYALGLPAFAAIKLLAPACTACGETRAPVAASLGAIALGLALSWGANGFEGLALATTIAAWLQALALFAAAGRRLGGSSGAFFSKRLAASVAVDFAAAALIGFGLNSFLPQKAALLGTSGALFGRMGVAAAGSAALYFSAKKLKKKLRLAPT